MSMLHMADNGCYTYGQFMDDQQPVVKIQGDRLKPANKVLIFSGVASVLAIIVQFWFGPAQYVLYVSLPIAMTALMYEGYVRYKMQLAKEERAPDWNKVRIQKEVPMELGKGDDKKPPSVQMPGI